MTGGMKSFLILLAATFTISSFAEDAKTNAAPSPDAGKGTVLMFPASSGVISAPMVLTNGCISQSETTEVEGGGKAVYEFTIASAGDYVIRGMVSAPADDANSFFINVDAQPDDQMIWDIDVTSGFEERTVSWRGSGTGDSDEFSPKIFKLTAGKHKLFIVGREAEAELKTITIRPATETKEPAKKP